MESKIYVIGSDFLQYLSNIQNEKVFVWSTDIKCALVFLDYQKAYRLVKKIRKAYGYDEKCKVIRLTEKNCKEGFHYLQNKAK